MTTKKERRKFCDCRINFHGIKNKVLLVNTQTLSYIFQKVDLFFQGSLVLACRGGAEWNRLRIFFWIKSYSDFYFFRLYAWQHVPNSKIEIITWFMRWASPLKNLKKMSLSIGIVLRTTSSINSFFLQK